MVDDVILNKVAMIERCLARVREEYGGDERNLRENLTRQDSIILNLQRACEASIDLAMALVKRQRLGPPQESRHAFGLLEEAGGLDRELATRMARMVGFRNVAVHDYQRLNLDVVNAIVLHRLGDFEALPRPLSRRLTDSADGPATPGRRAPRPVSLTRESRRQGRPAAVSPVRPRHRDIIGHTRTRTVSTRRTCAGGGRFRGRVPWVDSRVPPRQYASTCTGTRRDRPSA